MNIPKDSDIHDGEHSVSSLRKEIKRGFKRVRDYGGRNTVTIAWNLNEKANQDGIFAIEMNGKTAYVSKEEMLKALRWA